MNKKTLAAGIKACDDLQGIQFILTNCIDRIDAAVLDCPEKKEAFDSILNAIAALQHAYLVLSK